MNPFLDAPRTVLDLAGIRAWNTDNLRARAAYYATECGTYGGYKRHVRNHETTCDDCRAAYNQRAAERRAAKKEGK